MNSKLCFLGRKLSITSNKRYRWTIEDDYFGKMRSFTFDQDVKKEISEKDPEDKDIIDFIYSGFQVIWKDGNYWETPSYTEQEYLVLSVSSIPSTSAFFLKYQKLL